MIPTIVSGQFVSKKGNHFWFITPCCAVDGVKVFNEFMVPLGKTPPANIFHPCAALFNPAHWHRVFIFKRTESLPFFCLFKYILLARVVDCRAFIIPSAQYTLRALLGRLHNSSLDCALLFRKAQVIRELFGSSFFSHYAECNWVTVWRDVATG